MVKSFILHWQTLSSQYRISKALSPNPHFFGVPDSVVRIIPPRTNFSHSRTENGTYVKLPNCEFLSSVLEPSNFFKFAEIRYQIRLDVEIHYPRVLKLFWITLWYVTQSDVPCNPRAGPQPRLGWVLLCRIWLTTLQAIQSWFNRSTESISQHMTTAVAKEFSLVWVSITKFLS